MVSFRPLRGNRGSNSIFNSYLQGNLKQHKRYATPLSIRASFLVLPSLVVFNHTACLIPSSVSVTLQGRNFLGTELCIVNEIVRRWKDLYYSERIFVQRLTKFTARSE